jgi:hypothetical protein
VKHSPALELSALAYYGVIAAIILFLFLPDTASRPERDSKRAIHAAFLSAASSSPTGSSIDQT